MSFRNNPAFSADERCDARISIGSSLGDALTPAGGSTIAHAIASPKTLTAASIETQFANAAEAKYLLIIHGKFNAEKLYKTAEAESSSLPSWLVGTVEALIPASNYEEIQASLRASKDSRSYLAESLKTIPPALAGLNNATAPYDAVNNRLIVFGGWVYLDSIASGYCPTRTD